MSKLRVNYLDNSILPIKCVARSTEKESVSINAVSVRNLIKRTTATFFIRKRGQRRGKLHQRKRTEVEEEKEKVRKPTETEVKLEVEIEE